MTTCAKLKERDTRETIGEVKHRRSNRLREKYTLHDFFPFYTTGRQRHSLKVRAIYFDVRVWPTSLYITPHEFRFHVRRSSIEVSTPFHFLVLSSPNSHYPTAIVRLRYLSVGSTAKFNEQNGNWSRDAGFETRTIMVHFLFRVTRIEYKESRVNDFRRYTRSFWTFDKMLV